MTGEPIDRPAPRWSALRAFAVAVARQAGASGLVTAALVTVSALLDGVGLLLLAPLLGLITGGGEGWVQQSLARFFAIFGLTDRLAKLWVLLALFLVLATLRALANARRDVALARLQTGFAQSERNRLIKSLAQAPWPRLAALRHAETMTLLSSETQRLASACNYLVQGVLHFALLLVQAAVAFLLAPALAAAALVMAAAGTLLFIATQRRIHEAGEGVVRANQAMMASAAALFGGLKSALAQSAQHSFVAEFGATQAALRKHQLAFSGRQARGGMIYSIASALLAAGIVAIGIGFFAVPAANLLAVVVVFARMGPRAQQLYQSAQTLIFTIPAFEAIRSTERSLAAAIPSAPAAPVRPPEGAIELSGVTYLHPSGGGVRDAALFLPPGLFLGVGGPSGAGKTTLADLVVGLLQPQAGTITIGGERLEGALRQGWSECLAYVTQDGFLFHDTVRRNLLWGTAAGEAEVAAALELVGAGTLISRLPRGLDSVVGERGAILSGGERQRLVLARALLRKPRLLVLDEAASAIDADSEAILLDRLALLPRRPAILMISHREDSLKRCDSIVHVGDGALRIER